MTDMKYTRLGHSDIEVSRICLGGMSFGEKIPDGHQWIADELELLEEPYTARELVGPIERPGEKPLAGTTDPNK